MATGRLIRHSGQKNLARKSMNKQKGQVVDQGQETGKYQTGRRETFEIPW